MEAGFDWKQAFLIEQRVAHAISKQAKHGCNFDIRSAHWHVFSLTEQILKIDFELVPLLPMMFTKGNEYKAPFKLNGQPKAFVQKYCEKVGLNPDDLAGPFTAVGWEPFDTGKSARVKSVMLDMGWVPTEWNSKKMPFQVFKYRKKLEKTSYAKFMNEECDDEERAELSGMVNAFIEKHFTNQSKGYMKAVLIGMGFEPGKIPTFDQIRKKLLLSQFWITSPKITEDSFDSVGTDEGRAMQLLKKRMMISHRRSLIIGLIELVRKDGKIAGEANPCATPTARMRHRGIVNIPAAGSFYGEQCRSLFLGDSRPSESAGRLISRLTDPKKFKRKPFTNIRLEFDEEKGKWFESGHCTYLVHRGHDAFVGGDGAGLELRMLTHYLVSVSKRLLEEAKEAGNQKGIEYYGRALQSAIEYREVLLHGDIHSHNQKLAGLPTRKSAKTFIYAFLYGAGDANLGGQLGEGKEKGAELRARFLKECPCIPVLIEWVQEFAKKNGWVPGIDGRKLIMRRDDVSGEVMAHKALNTMLQAAGSIVMKLAGCYLENWIKRDGLDCHQVIMMHDEYQFTCKWEDVPALRALIDSCVAKAGVYFKMDCPLASDSMLGANWCQTH